MGKSNITLRTFTHLRLSLTSDVEDTVPEVAVVMAVVVAAAFTTDGATGTVTAVGTLSFSFSVLSSAHKRFEVLQHNKQQHKKREKETAKQWKHFTKQLITCKMRDGFFFKKQSEKGLYYEISSWAIKLNKLRITSSQ